MAAHLKQLQRRQHLKTEEVPHPEVAAFIRAAAYNLEYYYSILNVLKLQCGKVKIKLSKQHTTSKECQ